MSEDPRKPGGDEPIAPDEEARLDDAVIGRAFKGSAIAFAAIAAVAVLAVWWWNREPARAGPTEAEVVEARALVVEAEPPDLPFADVTEAWGVSFVHENGATGGKLLPETMGGGVAAFDYDGDGDMDLLFVNSDRWPGEGSGPAPTTALYRNDDGRFVDVSREAGLDVRMYGMGVAIGDVDGDGDPDVFLTAVGSNRLYRNDGGRFVDVTSRAGVAGGDDTWSTSAGFFDYDGDGDLDLFVANYVKWSPEIDRAVDFQLAGLGRAYGPPTNFEGRHPYLYRNEGDGRFVEVGESAGLHVANEATGLPVAKALALCFFDLGRDGDPDVLVANDTTRNFLYENRGDGSFAEIGAVAGVGFDAEGNATGAMGVDAADYRDEGMLGLAIANFANEMSSLYVADDVESARFSDEAIAEGVGAPSRRRLSFGLFFFDVDLDGRLDLFQANGHLEEEIQKVQSSQSYAQPAQLFWNGGPARRSTFVEIPAEKLGDLAKPIVGRGAVYADLDADGDLDVVMTEVGGRPRVLRNDQAAGGHSLRLRPIDARSGVPRIAIGAEVSLDAGGGRVQRRRVERTKSYLSSVEPIVTFGLGTDAPEGPIEIEVTWPDGALTRHSVPLVANGEVVPVERTE